MHRTSRASPPSATGWLSSSNSILCCRRAVRSRAPTTHLERFMATRNRSNGINGNASGGIRHSSRGAKPSDAGHHIDAETARGHADQVNASAAMIVRLADEVAGGAAAQLASLEASLTD